MLNIALRYFNWLIKQVECSSWYNISDYKTILKYLHQYYYSPSNPMDLNRVQEALDLRHRFYGDLVKTIKWMSYDEMVDHLPIAEAENQCTILELFVGCSVYFAGNDGIPSGWVFFQILRNTGLSVFDNAFCEYMDHEEILPTWESRVFDRIVALRDLTYGPTGAGGGMFRSFVDGDIRENEIKEQYDFFYRDYIRPIMEVIPDVLFDEEE